MTATRGSAAREPRMDPRDEAAMLRAIAALKDELVTLINTGLGAIQHSIAQLQAQHAAALLEQEKRNSGFADRERVESAIRRIDLQAADIQRLYQREDESAADRRDLHALIATVESRRHNQTISFLRSGYGLLLALFLSVIGPTLVILIGHLWK